MDWYRIKHTIGMYLSFSGSKRAEYIRKHKVFAECGENNMFMFRKIPLYPKLIKVHNNVWIASNVTFITHDVIHKMLNNKERSADFQEKIGCIEIEDNVFVGANTTILYNVRICANTIIGAGSLVNKSISESGGVWAGVPVRYICSIEEYEKKLRQQEKITVVRKKAGLAECTVEECWKQFETNNSIKGEEDEE